MIPTVPVALTYQSCLSTQAPYLLLGKTTARSYALTITQYLMVTMKLTKDRFSTWEDKDGEDYQKEYDDELIIKVHPYESSKDIADYILSLQVDLDRLLIRHDEVREELGNMKYVAIVLKEENTELKDELANRGERK